MWFTASSEAMAMASSEPITTTKRMAVSESPNQRIATGSQQMEGKACSPSTTGFTARCRKGMRPRKMPSGTPMTMEMR